VWEKQITIVGKNGISQGDFELTNDIPGGLYTLKAYTNWQKNDPDPAFFIKEIQIQETVLPSLKMKLDFDKKAYGPGDKVKAELSVETNQNKPLSLFPASYIVNINGVQTIQNSFKGDKNGKAILTFDLPSELSSTDGILMCCWIMMAGKNQYPDPSLLSLTKYRSPFSLKAVMRSVISPLLSHFRR
jgi:hypothetical protein